MQASYAKSGKRREYAKRRVERILARGDRGSGEARRLFTRVTAIHHPTSSGPRAPLYSDWFRNNPLSTGSAASTRSTYNG